MVFLASRTQRTGSSGVKKMKQLNEILPSDLIFTEDTIKELIMIHDIKIPFEDINLCNCNLIINEFKEDNFVACFVYLILEGMFDFNFYVFEIRCFFTSEATKINYFCLNGLSSVCVDLDVNDLYLSGILSEKLDDCDLFVRKLRTQRTRSSGG